MGKITFRADDDLVDELESFDASKSEVMREALRSYLGRSACEQAPKPAGTAGTGSSGPAQGSSSLDDLLEDRIDDALTERLSGNESTDVNLRITVDSDGRPEADGGVAGTSHEPDVVSDSFGGFDDADVNTIGAPASDCSQCGMRIESTHVYCPNCGEKTTGQVYCECGDEVRSDWAFCPSCGRRTPAADVLDSA